MERERERERQTDRQTDRQTERDTGRQRQRRKDRDKERQTERDRQKDTERETETERQHYASNGDVSRSLDPIGTLKFLPLIKSLAVLTYVAGQWTRSFNTQSVIASKECVWTNELTCWSVGLIVF